MAAAMASGCSFLNRSDLRLNTFAPGAVFSRAFNLIVESAAEPAAERGSEDPMASGCSFLNRSGSVLFQSVSFFKALLISAISTLE